MLIQSLFILSDLQELRSYSTNYSVTTRSLSFWRKVAFIKGKYNRLSTQKRGFLSLLATEDTETIRDLYVGVKPIVLFH